MNYCFLLETSTDKELNWGNNNVHPPQIREIEDKEDFLIETRKTFKIADDVEFLTSWDGKYMVLVYNPLRQEMSAYKGSNLKDCPKDVIEACAMVQAFDHSCEDSIWSEYNESLGFPKEG